MDLMYELFCQFCIVFDELYVFVVCEVGLNDFGLDDYFFGFIVLFQLMDYDLQFSVQGCCVVWGQVVGVLKGWVYVIVVMMVNLGFDWYLIVVLVVIIGVLCIGIIVLYWLMVVDLCFQGLQIWLFDLLMFCLLVESWVDYFEFCKIVVVFEVCYVVVLYKCVVYYVVVEEIYECCMFLW